MNNIYHFCQDEKFINSAYQQFETLYPGKNKFLVYDADTTTIKHLNVTSAYHFVSDVKTEIQQVPPNTVVIFHSLPNHILRYINLLDDSVKTVWLCFGYEVYNDINLYSENKTLDKNTKRHFGAPPATLKEQVFEKTLPLHRIFRPSVGYSLREQKLKKLKRVNYLGCSFDEEFKQIKKLTKVKAPLFKFWYYPLEKILDINMPISLDKNSVLVGNSGTKSGNHLDVLEKLKKLGVRNEEFVIPLSYGNAGYIDYIKKTFNLSSNKVVFQEDFLKLEEYNSILSRAKVALFNTRRQQAIGNIVALIYHGAKVFISEKNTFYHFLKRKGVLVYSYENELNSKSFKTLMTKEEIERNRKFLYNILNEKKILEELKTSVDKILK